MADNINQTLEDLTASIKDATAASGECCDPKGSKTGAGGSIQQPVYGGIDDEYQDAESFFDARCNASNGVYDTILGVIAWLDDNNVDLKAGAFGGLTTGLVFAFLGAGPLGWAIVGAGAAITSVLIWLVTETVDFEALVNSLDDVHEELVTALYNASDATAARASFLLVLAGATPTPSSGQLYLIELLLQNDVVNNIMEPRSDVAGYQSPDPIDCGSVVLQVWTFAASGESWAFRDDSTGTNSASGAWDSPTQSWKMTIITTAGVTGRAKGTIYLTGLSIAVGAGNSVQFDFGPSSDGVNSSKHLWVKYTDLSEYETMISGGPSGGTIILTLPAAGIVEEIECSISRDWLNASTHTREVLEVRVQ